VSIVAAVEADPSPADPPPLPRALAWAWDVLVRYGRPDGGSLVRVPLTQRQLAEKAGCSAGTISWYLRCLGPAVHRSDVDLVLDRVALGAMETESAVLEPSPRCTAVGDELVAAFGRPGPGGRVDLVVVRHGRSQPASLADMAQHLAMTRSSAHRHLQALERSGRFGRDGRWHFAVAEPAPHRSQPDPAPVRLAATPEPRVLALVEQLVDLAQAVTRLAEEVLGEAARPTGAHGARADAAQTTELRAVPVASGSRVSSLSDLTDETSSQSSHSPRREPSAREPVRAEGSRSVDPVELPQLLAPLLVECERRRLPTVTDARGLAEALAPYTAGQIAGAACRLAADLAAGAPMRSPIAILVSKARDGDTGYFAAMSSAPTATPVPPPAIEVIAEDSDVLDDIFARASADAEAARALAALSPTERGCIDDIAEERARAAMGPYRGRHPQGLELWRRIVWRERSAGGAE